MSYDEKLATRVRSMLSVRDDVVERKMFGGLCFMVSFFILVALAGLLAWRDVS